MARPWVELSAQECARLIAGGGVGRIAVCTPMGPQIYPVAFVVASEAIIFRTTPYGTLGTLGLGTAAAFEVDDLDPAQQAGWSVVATGLAQAMSDPDEIADLRERGEPQPWVDGLRTLYIRLKWRTITGRRIGAQTVRPSTSDASLVG
ncbi:MAG: pyridoxamine 5'-phosphate oxidase family protein [Nocardioidaceae bacterium]|nr:pyridoxamine 5'-phosphate oxidase family protein [Nocardioidaceae bacterium]